MSPLARCPSACYRLVCLALLFLGILPQTFAQETSGGISGSIADKNRYPLAGVVVKMVHVPSGSVYNTVTNSKGTYNVVNLRPGGPYQITVSQVGMQAQVREGVNIALGQTLQLDFALVEAVTSLGGVVVKATRGAARANATGAGTNIGSNQLRNLASSSRSLQDYTKLTPQFNGNSFGGANFRYNNVTIDGAINNDAIGFSPSLGGQTGTSGQPGSSTRSTSISIEAIQDIQVYLAPYDVKIGNFTGGSVNAVTRSGSNTVSGSLYGYGRNATLTGPDNYGKTGKLPSTFKDYQTGFRIGFPIVKNRLFWFLNGELSRRTDPLTQTASSAISQQILSEPDAKKIADYSNGFGFDPGTYGATSIFSESKKIFNRLDWVAGRHQLAIRSNIVFSSATNLERDDQNFRFSSIDYLQTNRQYSTVAELKSRFGAVSNSLIAGYSAIHDFRDPSSKPYYPQVQIGGRLLGTTILLGTDREASIFDLKQNTTEITDNLTYFKGNHTFTLGTHNELYQITYNFVNSPNGRIDYPNIDAYLASQPSRIRGSYNFTNQDRDYIFSRPSAKFKVNLYSAYLQDEIKVSNRFKIIPGLRADFADVPTKQLYSVKTAKALLDPTFNTTYAYTPASQVGNTYLGRIQLSPRVGFNLSLDEGRTWIMRGGTGFFTGRIPFAWLGYAFYNNGNTYGAFDRRDYSYVNDQAAGRVAVTPAVNPLIPSPDGIAASARGGNPVATDPNGITQVDLIDNRFKMPKVWRTSLAFDKTTQNGFKFSVEGIFTQTLNDVKFQQINLRDTAGYYEYDKARRQPIFNAGNTDLGFTSIYLLSNTKYGYRYSLTFQGGKTFERDLSINLAYTYGHSKDISNGIRNSEESNWQLNQALNPNSPTLASSNFDIRHRAIVSFNYGHAWGSGGRFITHFNLFLSGASGQPFTYGFVNSSIQNTGQQVSLAYIPKDEEFSYFFRSGDIRLSDGSTAFKSQGDQAAEFYNYIKTVPYLVSRKGSFTERNGARTPWNFTGDARIMQEIKLGTEAANSKHHLFITLDVFNFLNLLEKTWGRVYYVSNLFNSTASVGLRPAGATAAGYPIYIFEQPAQPYQVDQFASRWQMQLGVRYNF